MAIVNRWRRARWIIEFKRVCVCRWNFFETPVFSSACVAVCIAVSSRGLELTAIAHIGPRNVSREAGFDDRCVTKYVKV